ncbi:MAG: hypothetical protein ACO20W_10535, partial [Anaerohalosphaeraceae bacterium]
VKTEKVKNAFAFMVFPFHKYSVPFDSIRKNHSILYGMVYCGQDRGECQDLFSLLFEVFLILSTMYSILWEPWPNRKKPNPIA